MTIPTAGVSGGAIHEISFRYHYSIRQLYKPQNLVWAQPRGSYAGVRPSYSTHL